MFWFTLNCGTIFDRNSSAGRPASQSVFSMTGDVRTCRRPPNRPNRQFQISGASRPASPVARLADFGVKMSGMQRCGAVTGRPTSYSLLWQVAQDFGVTIEAFTFWPQLKKKNRALCSVWVMFMLIIWNNQLKAHMFVKSLLDIMIS